ncbi:hypothetical protein BREVNS_1663 [Brevinematales bacterium NS]|nr:hypothetical protein [Brevinematales bacterium]QJR22413.1 hypothetical protein BREVNS_1663 [Brevinematales bacterium NS]
MKSLKTKMVVLLWLGFSFVFSEEEKKIQEATILFHSTYHTNVVLYLYFQEQRFALTIEPRAKTNHFWYFRVPVFADSQKIFYYFNADGMGMIDPFASSVEVDGGTFNWKRPLKEGIKKPLWRRFVFVSEHFEYYGPFPIDRTQELEKYYRYLTNLLAPFQPQLQKPKIRYYAISFTGNSRSALWAFPWRGEIFDSWDCASSHEIIHMLVIISNWVFNEGVAQCFQKEGNYDYREQNVNFVARQYLEGCGISPGGCNVVSLLMRRHESPTIGNYYHIAASFIYYHWFILGEKEKMARFLRSLEYTDTASAIDEKYRAVFGRTFSEGERAWAEWLLSSEMFSQPYVDWSFLN